MMEQAEWLAELGPGSTAYIATPSKQNLFEARMKHG